MGRKERGVRGRGVAGSGVGWGKGRAGGGGVGKWLGLIWCGGGRGWRGGGAGVPCREIRGASQIYKRGIEKNLIRREWHTKRAGCI